jgi:hypothetical protein
MENEILLLTDLLDQFENGSIIPENNAHKCYLTELHQHKGIVTWVHDHELRGHSLLRKMGKSSGRDLLRQPQIVNNDDITTKSNDTYKKNI